MYTPTFNTSAGGNLNFIFDVAFAKKSDNNTDQLKIYASKDCGASWILRRTYSASQLATVSNTAGNFIPGSSDWQKIVVPMSAFAQNDPVMMKIEFTSGGGNDLFIDRMGFGVGTTVGLSENETLQSRVYPNPAKENVNITFETPQTGNYFITDVSGKQVLNASFSLKDHLEVDLNNLPAGIYILNATTENGSGTHKIVKE